MNRFKLINKLINIKNKSTLDKLYYSTKSTPTLHQPHNKKPLDIDFNNVISLLNNYNNNNNNNNSNNNNNNNNNKLDSITNIQQQILNCNENEIIDWDRVLAARILNRIEANKNLHPTKLDKNILEKIWSLINIDMDSSTENYLTILGDQLGIAIKSWYLYPQAYDSVKKLVNEIGKLENDGKFDPSDSIISQAMKNAYHVAYVLGMWKEMIWIRSKMDDGSIKDTETFYKSPDQFGAHQAFKIITDKISNSIFKSSKPIADIHKDSTLVQQSEIYPFKHYNIASTKFRNQHLVNVNMDDVEFGQLKNQFDQYNNNESIKKDQFGYQSFPFKEESFLSIVGKAVKYSDGIKVYSGIYDKNSSRAQLYSNFEFPGLNISYEEQMDLKVEFTNGRDDISSITLSGPYRCSTINNGKSYIMDMDVFYSFKLQK